VTLLPFFIAHRLSCFAMRLWATQKRSWFL